VACEASSAAPALGCFEIKVRYDDFSVVGFGKGKKKGRREEGER
jgi:hypothetical protein